MCMWVFFSFLFFSVFSFFFFFTYCTHLNPFLRGYVDGLKSLLYLSDLARCCELARQYKAKVNNYIQRVSRFGLAVRR